MPSFLLSKVGNDVPVVDSLNWVSRTMVIGSALGRRR